MDNVNKTLYIPLFGKALVSRLGLILDDPMAEKIWDSAGFSLKGKAASKWLAYTMGMRSAVFDSWLREKLDPGAVVLHLGCGLDSRCCRVSCENPWFDVDFPAVIRERKRYFAESETYHMVGCDLRQNWLAEIPAGGTAIVVMEGVSMYLTAEERLNLLKTLSQHFETVHLLLDAYTVFAARATKYKNPINEVGVTTVYGFDDPRELEAGTSFRFLREHDLTPEAMIAGLPGREQGFFRLFFGGKAAKKIYRLYEYVSP
jgi:O-methyltransferase involved in polyketide biosynthesis